MELNSADIEEYRTMLTGRARCLRYMFDWPALLEVDDVVSSALIKAWKRRAEFRGDPACRPQLAAWLMRILNSVIVDALRWHTAEKRTADKTRSFEDFVNESDACIERFLVADISTASGRLQKDEMIQAAYAAIELLPPRQRICVLARFIGGWPISEIVEQFNNDLEAGSPPVTEKAVMSLIDRALKKLRSALEHMK